MCESVIELVQLTKRYGHFTAVDRLDLKIHKGEIFGLLGPNGAGKSTTILMMLGLTDPTSGTVHVCGINSTTYPVEVRKKVGYLPEDVGFYDDMTGPENLLYTARLNNIPEQEAQQHAAQLLERVGLDREIDKKTGKYSRGMRQRLGLADVLIKNPEVIILDEPTSGIDPAGVQEFISLIRQLRDERGLTVLFSSHHLDQVQQICDRVGLFSQGRLLADLSLNDLQQEEHALKEYFGDDVMVPLYIEVEDGLRLSRALERERAQLKPQYAELCRRFLADAEDFSEENLERAGIKRRFQNIDKETCMEEILREINVNL